MSEDLVLAMCNTCKGIPDLGRILRAKRLLGEAGARMSDGVFASPYNCMMWLIVRRDANRHFITGQWDVSGNKWGERYKDIPIRSSRKAANEALLAEARKYSLVKIKTPEN